MAGVERDSKIAYMTNRNLVPLDGWVPGGASYEAFQPDRYASVLVRDHFVAMVDRKDNLTIHCVDVVSSRMKTSSVTFSQDYIAELLDEETDSVENIGVSGLAVANGVVSLYLRISDLLVRMDVRGETLSMIWSRSTQNWVLPVTDGYGHYLYASREGERMFYLNPNGEERLVYTETDPSFTIKTTPSRQEFGIDQMFFLSPDKKKVAFYRLNDAEVTTFPVTSAPNGAVMPTTTHLKYPLAGTQSPEKVVVSVLDLTTGDVVNLKGDPSICYWTGITWSPDSRSIFSFVVDRRQQISRLLRFDARNGALVGEILREESRKYVEPEHSLYFVDDDRFFFQSRSYSGYNHIYLFDLKSNTLNQVTQGNWEVTQFLGYSATRDAVLYLATKNSPLNRDFFATRLSDGETFSLSNSFGTHQIFMDEKPSVWVDLYHSATEPGVTTLGCLECYGDTQVLMRSRHPYEGYDLPERIVGILPKANPSEDDLYYRITKPKHIKEGEHLPVVFYVYGGPHVQLITNSWGSGTKGFEEMMADAGCVVFCIDPHGSYNRGMDFESAICDDINGPQIRDYKYALNWLFLTHDYVDRERVAIYGWSFGGFMTLSMLLRSGFPFKVGVAGGAVVSWRYYETMYTERYMSLDEEGGTSGEHFDRTDMARYVEHLKCPLLMIHCCEDPVVLPLQLNYFLSALNKCGEVNELVDCYLYPGHEHNVRGEERVNLMRKVRAMIFRYV